MTSIPTWSDKREEIVGLWFKNASHKETDDVDGTTGRHQDELKAALREGFIQYVHLIKTNYLKGTEGVDHGSLLILMNEFDDDIEILAYLLKIFEIFMYSELRNLIWKRHKNNEQFVTRAIKDNPWYLGRASPRLRDNKKIVIEAVTKDGNALKYASPRLQNDIDTVRIAVSGTGYGLRWASPNLRDNKHLVIDAVKDAGFALQYASPRLQNDFDTVLSSVSNFGWAIDYASKPLQHNLDIRATSELQILRWKSGCTGSITTSKIHEIPHKYFPFLFEKASPLIVYYFLKNRQDLVIPDSHLGDDNSAVASSPISSDKKRKRSD